MSKVSRKPSTATRIAGAEVDIIGGKHDASGPGPEVMEAGTLTGDEVRNSSNETLGHIEAIMLDVSRGRIAYAVLAFGGFLGIGEKLFAVPWRALTLDADRRCFILPVPSERLKEAPGFDKNHWPRMADPQWAGDVHRFYDSAPYWVD